MGMTHASYSARAVGTRAGVGRNDWMGTGRGPSASAEAGFDCHLVKPVAVAALREILNAPPLSQRATSSLQAIHRENLRPPRGSLKRTCMLSLILVVPFEDLPRYREQALSFNESADLGILRI